MRRDGEMVDALDSDSSVCKNIWVQVPFSTPEQKNPTRRLGFFFKSYLGLELSVKKNNAKVVVF